MTNVTLENIIESGDVVDWTREEFAPRKLIELFSEAPETPEETAIRPPIKTDIDISPKRKEVSVMSPADYGIVEWDDKGHSKINKRRLVDFLKDNRIVYENGIPYRFDGCIYRKVSEKDDVEPIAYNAVNSIPGAPFLTRTALGDVLAMLRATSTWADVSIPEAFWDDCRYDGTLVPFQNGIYNIDTDDFLPFTPYLFIKHQLGAWYNPKVREHPVSKIYENIIPDKATRRFYFEQVGYSLFSPTMSPPAIFIIYGPGNTGKSALQSAVIKAIGPSNVSKMSIAQICGEFTTVNLKDHLINVSGETGSGQSQGVSKADGELIKQLSEGQTVEVNRKHKDSILLTNTAKLWFITNSPPDFGDTTSGLYRRLYIIPCRVEQNWEDQIYDKLTEEDAVSWLVNRALLAYRDFLDNGSSFHVSKEIRNEVVCYRTQEALMDFLEDYFGTSDKIVVMEKLDGMLIRDLYRDYKNFVIETGGKPLATRKFSEKIRNEFSMQTEKVRGVQDDGRPTNLTKFVNPLVKRS